MLLTVMMGWFPVCIGLSALSCFFESLSIRVFGRFVGWLPVGFRSLYGYYLHCLFTTIHSWLIVGVFLAVSVFGLAVVFTMSLLGFFSHSR